ASEERYGRHRGRSRRSPDRTVPRSRRRGRERRARHPRRARRSGRGRASRRPRGIRARRGPRRRTRGSGPGSGRRACPTPHGLYGSRTPARDESVGFRPVPIHLRANAGDYAHACLLPGDPLRAQYIAETFLTDVVQVNAERGLLGYTGSWDGKRVSVQGTGMGCPGAAIVFEELVQLGVRKLLRVGTCGGLQADHSLGDLIVALTAVPADSTAAHLVGDEPHCPTASWELVHEAVHVAKTSDLRLRVGPIVSSDLFYNPDEG